MHIDTHILLLLYTFITTNKKERFFSSERTLLRARKCTASGLNVHCFGYENPLLRERTSVRMELNHSVQWVSIMFVYFANKRRRKKLILFL